MANRERLIFLDTETTGLDANLGHRLIEVAAVESVGRRLTGRKYHTYLNPEREIDVRAQEIHGINLESLADKPKFAQVVDDLLAFLAGSKLCIHNADFDLGFLNAELARLGRPPIAALDVEVVDTVAMARSLYPGKRNSLDALCERLGVDNSARQLHGALLDARLLAEVYFAMTRGQENLDVSLPAVTAVESIDSCIVADEHPQLCLIPVDARVLAEHLSYLERIKAPGRGQSVWMS